MSTWLAPMAVAGHGFWAPGIASAADLVAGTRDPDLRSPTTSPLGARAHARASLLTRMLCHVAGAACEAAGVSLSASPSIFGSAYGELGRMMELLSTPEGKPLSPLRFQLSVHNAAGGQLSIATGNQLASTSLCAGGDTPQATLLEAYGQLQTGAEQVVVAFGDEGLPEALGGARFEPLACALVLRARAQPGDVLLHLRGDGADADPSPPDQRVGEPFADRLSAFAHNPCRGGAALCWALQTGQMGVVAIHGDQGRSTQVQLESQS